MAKLGPNHLRCTCTSVLYCFSKCWFLSTAATPRGAQLGGSDSTEGPRNLVAPSPPDVSSLENTISELKRNISLIKTFMVRDEFT